MERKLELIKAAEIHPQFLLSLCDIASGYFPKTCSVRVHPASEIPMQI